MRRVDSVVLKDVPFPDDISETGINECELHNAIKTKYPNAKTERFKKDGKPMHIVKITPEDQNQAEEFLQTGFNIGNLGVRVEKALNKPRVIQCFKCFQMGHIATVCQNPTKCSKYANEGHGYPD